VSGLLVAPPRPTVDGDSPILKDIPYLILGGSRDTDVSAASVGYFDQAQAPQRYFQWIHGANHSQWNARTQLFPTVLLDGLGFALPMLTRVEQEDLLRGWGRLWFEATVLGQRRADAHAVFAGDSVLRGTRSETVFPSYSSNADLFLDRHENGAFPVTNVPGNATSAGFSLGMVESPLTGAPNESYNHRTSGAFGEWSQPASFTYNFNPGQNASPFSQLSFRVARGASAMTEVPATNDLGITVQISNGFSTRTLAVSPPVVGGGPGLPGRRVPAPYRISSYPREVRTVMRTVRIPFRCLDPLSTFNFSTLRSVTIVPTTIPSGPQRIVVDDLALSN
jgi:hypothetical protein